MKKFLENLNVIVVAYTIGLAHIVLFFFLRRTGMVIIDNLEDWPKLKKKMIAVFNHDDAFDCMYEIFLAPCLFYRQWLLHPLKWVPWFILDGANFVKKLIWKWLEARAVVVHRDRAGEKNSSVPESRTLSRLLNEREAVVFTWGSGRDCTYMGKPAISKLGLAKRPLSRSVGWLWADTQATILPIAIWNGGAPLCPGKRLFSFPSFRRGPVIVRFGKPIEFAEEIRKMTPRERAKFIDDKLLALEDEIMAKKNAKKKTA